MHAEPLPACPMTQGRLPPTMIGMGKGQDGISLMPTRALQHLLNEIPARLSRDVIPDCNSGVRDLLCGSIRSVCSSVLGTLVQIQRYRYRCRYR